MISLKKKMFAPTKPSNTRRDLTYLLILISIGLVIGTYQVSKTVMIAKDGVFYIERAQKLASSPVEIIKAHPPGYPILIFLSHKFVTLFSKPTLHTWIYSAQCITLLCRLLSFVPLFFIGKVFVGAKKSFYSIVILIFLPYPAYFGSDALRDWPYLLFLISGFLLLLQGIRRNKSRMFGWAGIATGLGYLIRPMCIQLLIYGFLLLGFNFLNLKKRGYAHKMITGMFLLIIGFLIPAGPYMRLKGEIIPTTFRSAIGSFSTYIEPEKPTRSNLSHCDGAELQVAGLSNKMVEATGKFLEKASANLMWFFVLPCLLGLYYHLKKKAGREEKLLIPVFISINIIALFLRYLINPDLTHRYILPLTVFSSLYIPTGLRLIYLMTLRNRSTVTLSCKKAQKSFYLLLIIGLCICIPKLLRPIRIEKQGYLEACQWLKNNTPKEKVIATQDRRIYFYAERTGLIYYKNPPGHIDYTVTIEGGKHAKPKFNVATQQEYSVFVDTRKKKGKKLVIYKKM